MSAEVIPSLLKKPREPWLLEWVGVPPRAYEFAWATAENGVVSRVLRGSKMTSLQGLWDEVGAALQFPNYFGENQAALEECLTDLSWLPGQAYLVVVVDAVNLLEHDSDDRFAMFVETLDSAAQTWAAPIELGEWWDRPAIPFHVAFQVGPETREKLHTRFAATRVEVARWESWTS